MTDKEGQGGRGIIAVNLDGVLARHTGWEDVADIGKPVSQMVLRVKQWIKDGRKVVIFTSRVSRGPIAIKAIQDWLKQIGIGPLDITNVKTPEMTEFYEV